jgi:hypothetical protein
MAKRTTTGFVSFQDTTCNSGATGTYPRLQKQLAATASVLTSTSAVPWQHPQEEATRTPRVQVTIAAYSFERIEAPFGGLAARCSDLGSDVDGMSDSKNTSTTDFLERRSDAQSYTAFSCFPIYHDAWQANAL